jgi:acetyl esterase/lipase
MLQWVGIIYALSVILGGTLRYFPIFPPLRALWYLQLAVSELGLALGVPLALMTCFSVFRRPRLSFVAILAPVALVVAALPVLETVENERDWLWDLQYHVGHDEKPDARVHSPYTGELAMPLFQFIDFFQLPSHPFAIKEEFKTDDGTSLPLYLYRSTTGEPGSTHPWIMSIHGGGWSNGDPRDLDQTIPFLLSAGYSVVAPSYRFAPAFPWPRQQTDVESAYRYVVENAPRLALDPKQVWLLGRSAGGQIALEIAYASKVVQNVKGVIALYTPTDLDFGYRWAQPVDILGSRDLLKDLVGTTPDLGPEKYRAASPIAAVKADSPPTLLIAGRADPLSWYRHSHRLADALKAAKVPVTHLELPWGTHGFDYFPNSPGGQVTRNAILRFLASP